LYDILDVKENVCEFDKVGAKRGFVYLKFYTLFQNFEVVNVLIRGK
jgi:hypothetical protein